jgi:maltose O-acetyltransferase
VTEKEKMLAGEMYDPLDPVLCADRERARALLHRLNVSEYGDHPSRRPILAKLIPHAEPDVWVEPPFFCDYGYNIFVGERTFWNFNCVFLDVMAIRIGARCMIGPAVQIYTATHPRDWKVRSQGREFARPVTIGDDCWIGGAAVILPGVTIGHRCIIGAGAIVTRDVPDDSLALAAPAGIRDL